MSIAGASSSKKAPEETLLILAKIIPRHGTISADVMSAKRAVGVQRGVVGTTAAAAVEDSHDGKRVPVREVFCKCLQDELMQRGSRIGTDFVFLARSILIVCSLKRFDMCIPFPESLKVDGVSILWDLVVGKSIFLGPRGGFCSHGCLALIPLPYDTHFLLFRISIKRWSSIPEERSKWTGYTSHIKTCQPTDLGPFTRIDSFKNRKNLNEKGKRIHDMDEASLSLKRNPIVQPLKKHVILILDPVIWPGHFHSRKLVRTCNKTKLYVLLATSPPSTASVYRGARTRPCRCYFRGGCWRGRLTTRTCTSRLMFWPT